jgi:hypothetical protein
MMRNHFVLCLAIFVSSLGWSLALAQDAQPQTTSAKRVIQEGFENGQQITFALDNPWYRIDSIAPTEESAASGKRSLRIEATWNGHTWDEWFPAPLQIAYFGDAKVQAKLRIERGRARLGHPYAEPTSEPSGIVVCGEERGSVGNGWSQWSATAGGTLPENQCRQAALVYFRPVEQGQAVIYIDDVEIEAAFPPDAEAIMSAQAAAAKTQQREALQSRAAPVLKQAKQLAGRADGHPSDPPAAASPAMAESCRRLQESVRNARSELEREVAGFQANPSHDVLQSIRRLVALLAKQIASCSTMVRSLQSHTALPYVVWILDPTSNEQVLPKRFPLPGIIGTELRIAACAGEYEPASFAVQAVADLKEMIAVPSDLKCGNQTIPAAALDVRLVKCWWQAGVPITDIRRPVLVPELLLKDPDFVKVDNDAKRNTLKDPQRPRDGAELRPISVADGQSQQFWVAVRVPDAATPGIYRGAIRLTAANCPPLEVVIVLEVYPFRLEQPVLQYSMYYGGVLVSESETRVGGPDKSAAQYLGEMRNLKAHGVTHPLSIEPLGKMLDQAIELRKQAGIAVEPFYLESISTGHRDTAASLEGLKEVVGIAKRQLAAHGIKEFYVYGQDEAAGEELRRERKAIQIVHETGGKVFVACYKGAFELVGDLLDLANISGPLAPTEAEKWRAAGHKAFSYGNPQVGPEQPETYRRNYGLALWKAGYDGAMDWIYQSNTGNIYDDFDHPNSRDMVFAYPTADGVIDTVQWEGFREGVDDVRYLTTLLRAIERAKIMPERRGLADQAEQWLQTMDVDDQPNVLRAEIAKWILRLPMQPR